MHTQLRKPLPNTQSRQFTVYLPDELDQELRALAQQHGRTLSKQTEMVLQEGIRNFTPAPTRRNHCALTTRQRSVLQCLAAGLSIAEVAKRLGTSTSTVSFYRRQLGRELGLADGNIVLLLRAAVAAGELPVNVLARPVDELCAVPFE